MEEERSIKDQKTGKMLMKKSLECSYGDGDAEIRRSSKQE